MRKTKNTLQAALDAIKAIDIKDVPEGNFLKHGHLEEWKTELCEALGDGQCVMLLYESSSSLTGKSTANTLFLGWAASKAMDVFVKQNA